MKQRGPHKPPIARLLVDFRRSRGISATEFARIAGLAAMTIAAYEAGLRPVGPMAFKRIAEAVAKIKRENIVWRLAADEISRSETLNEYRR
jgi:transcriptional regulator with XRE-family HTH domain